MKDEATLDQLSTQFEKTKDPIISYWLARSYYFLFFNSDKAEYWLRAFSSSPFFGIHWLYGVIEYDRGNFDVAFTHFEKAVSLNPMSIFLLYYKNLAMWHLLDKKEEAIQFWDKSFVIEDREFLSRWLIAIEKKMDFFGQPLPYSLPPSNFIKGRVKRAIKVINKKFNLLLLKYRLKKRATDIATILSDIESFEADISNRGELLLISELVRKSKLDQTTKSLILIDNSFKIGEVESIKEMDIEREEKDISTFFKFKYNLLLRLKRDPHLAINYFKEMEEWIQNGEYKEELELEYGYLKGIICMVKGEEREALTLFCKICEEIPLLPYIRYWQWRKWIYEGEN